MSFMRKNQHLFLSAYLCVLALTGCGNQPSGDVNAASKTAHQGTSSAQIEQRARPAPTITASASANTSKSDGQMNDKAATPDDAARRLYAAWRKNDRPAAALVAAPRAINELFKTRLDPEAKDWEFGSCVRSEKGFDCDYYYEGGGTHFIVEGSQESGYRITSIRFIAD